MPELTHGADPDALERLADELLHTAERVALIGRYHLDRLTDLPWSGPDAERARQQWSYLWLTAIRPVSMALATASGEARRHATEQRDASGDAAAATGPAATASPTASGEAPPSGAPSGRQAVTIERIRDLLMEGPELATVVTAARAWENGLDAGTYGLASDILSNGSRLTRMGGAALTGVGLALDGRDLYQAAIDGDALGAVIPGTSGGLTVAALAGVGWAGPVGAAWGVGTTVGGISYDAMQGTTYGDHVQRRNDMAFETMGAWGMLIVPGNLALGVWDTLTDGDPSEPDGGGEGGGGGGR